MPEIAEVRTVKDTLKQRVLNKKIIDVKIIYPKMIESDISLFKSILINKKIIDITTIGKWLLFDLGEYILLSHLRMEGKYFIKDEEENIEKHEHIIFVFDDKSTLRYHDTRKFGKMNLIKKEDLYNTEAIKKQGPEPFDKKLTKEYLYDKIHNKSLAIKTILLDQTIISGLGNIYVNEVLFDAKINPTTKGKDITLDECQKIIDSSIKIITEAIKLGGTTIKSYTSSLGVTGRFQQKLKVHKKEGDKCFNCNELILNIKVNGRSTYYCPKCQR